MREILEEAEERLLLTMEIKEIIIMLMMALALALAGMEGARFLCLSEEI